MASKHTWTIITWENAALLQATVEEGPGTKPVRYSVSFGPDVAVEISAEDARLLIDSKRAEH